jgi:hypothetical protein
MKIIAIPAIGLVDIYTEAFRMLRFRSRPGAEDPRCAGRACEDRQTLSRQSPRPR